MTRTAIYIRKSREEANKPSHRLTVQREQLPAHAHAQGWSVEIYDDGHASAARGKVQDLQERARLEADIRAGRIDIILTIELSRLSRDDSLQDYVAWLHLCAEARVKLATMSRVLDPCQHSDWMLLLMEGGFSSVEMKVLKGRMDEGRRQAFRSGKWLGGTPPPPYRYDANLGRPVIDPEQLPRMQQIWKLIQTHSAQAVTKELNLPGMVVRRSVSDERLLIFQALRIDPETGETIPCDWEPVMDAETAARVRAGRRSRKGTVTRTVGALLSNLGLLHCAYCGRTAKTWHNSKTRRDGTRLDYYGCQSKSDRSACPDSRLVAQIVLDELVLSDLFHTLADHRLQEYWLTAKDHAGITLQIDQLRREEQRAEQRKRNIIDAIADGVISATDARQKLADLEAQIQQTTLRRLTLQQQMETPPDWESLRLTREDFGLLDNLEQRIFLRSALQKIEISAGTIRITYPFPRDTAGSRSTDIPIPQQRRGCGKNWSPLIQIPKKEQ